MYGPTRLDLVKSSLKLLVNNLHDEDHVVIAVYAGAAGQVLPSTPGSDKQKIKEALESPTAGGSTAGGAGIQLAYKTAKNNFIKGRSNRVILRTDEDFNVGASSTADLDTLIENERKSGIFLTVLGYGMGNYKEDRMQVLTQKGNGNHAYIDNIQEAIKVLVNEFGGTLFTIVKPDTDDMKSKSSLSDSPEMLTVKLRYKQPDEDISRKLEIPVTDHQSDKVSEDFRLASAVAMFGQLIKNSDFKGDGTYDKVIEPAKINRRRRTGIPGRTHPPGGSGERT
jgi:Ca-activated chloride channel family protein